jgi:hypothetical protein
MRQRNLLTVGIAGRAGRRSPLLLLARLPSRVPGGQSPAHGGKRRRGDYAEHDRRETAVVSDVELGWSRQ